MSESGVQPCLHFHKKQEGSAEEEEEDLPSQLQELLVYFDKTNTSH